VSRILIVDDDPQLGRSLERLLTREGHACRVASDPRAAAEAATAFKPDAVILGPFDDWLAKPAVPQEFLVRLRTALRRAGAAD
jgi:DNA-binding response OmpR family regulator